MGLVVVPLQPAPRAPSAPTTSIGPKPSAAKPSAAKPSAPTLSVSSERASLAPGTVKTQDIKQVAPNVVEVDKAEPVVAPPTEKKGFGLGALLVVLPVGALAVAFLRRKKR